jgi:hypothetical protein
MNKREEKLEPKLSLNMSFDELLGRLVQTKPKEVEASIARSKQKRPSTGAPRRRRVKRKK